MNISQPASNFFEQNRKNLISLLPQGSLAIINSSDEYPRNGDQSFPFRQNSDLYYLTGIDQEMTRLVLAPTYHNKDFQEVLFIRKPDPAVETWEGKKLDKELATSISGIKTILYNDSFDSFLHEVMTASESVYLNANEYPKYSNPVPYFDLRFSRELQSKFPLHKYERLAPLLKKLRMIKSETEIDLIRQAINITGLAFNRVLKNIVPGMKEYQIEAEITYAFMMNGARNHAYKPIIASGENACFLHYVTNSDICRSGDLLLMDFGAEYLNYAADITRTIPVNGRFTKRQKTFYDAIMKIQEQAGRLLVPGNTIDNVNKEVNAMMEESMIRLGLFSAEDVKKQPPSNPLYLKYFMHGVSHFIGLDVHDVGTKYEILQPGMVLTFEPGIYLREEKMGIRIENVILVTENGPVNLSENIPAEASEIESIMNDRNS
ncbi:MAG: aminopeptidase P N-terminal domain-containing protein [Bacteroidetes bacterium]|nr:aminopeptidase P N-terminal domain-containing protein [Bacteroidota bacterium]